MHTTYNSKLKNSKNHDSIVRNMIWFEFIKDKALLNFYLWRVWNIWITASVVTHLSSNCNRLSLENRTTVDRIDTFYPLTSHGGLYPKFDCMSHLFILRIVEGRLLLEWESLEYTILSIGMDWTGLVVPLLLILLLHGMSFLITQFLSSPLIPSFIALSLTCPFNWNTPWLKSSSWICGLLPLR